jgi:hypothetical protein
MPLRRPLANIDINALLAIFHAPAANHLHNVDPAILGEEELAEVATAVNLRAVLKLYSTVFLGSASASSTEAEYDLRRRYLAIIFQPRSRVSSSRLT